MLWWPRGYGKANLYEITTKLIYKESVLDTRIDFIGVRDIEFIHSDLKDSGKSDQGNFLFKVNGIPILCKGSNWIAADVFHSRDAERYDMMLELFSELLKGDCQKICIIIDEPDNWHVRVVAGNDSCSNEEGYYKIWDVDTGEVLLSGNFFAKANENSDLGFIRISHGEQGR